VPVVPPEVPVPVVPVAPVVVSDGAPPVDGPEPLGPVPLLVVVGDALPLGPASGPDAVLRDEVHAAARKTNRASAERPAITDFIQRLLKMFSDAPMRKGDAGDFLDTRSVRAASCRNPFKRAALRTGEPRWISE
jgi:hypothetical protein